MNSNMDTEREIDLKDLLYRAIKKWRGIVIGAIIIGLLAALYQAASGLRTMLDDEALAEAQAKYEIAVDDHEATGERLRTSIEILRDQSANQQEYNDKSELMKIDPMNKWNGNFQIYIDSKYQIDPTMTYQNIDLTGRLVSAYSSYLRSGEMYTELLNEIDWVDEIRFLTEIYSVSSDPNTATVTVRCVGKSETDIHEILGFVKQKITERYESIRTAIGDHDLEVLTESVYSTIDLELDATQKANLLAISEYANAIGEQNEKLTEWEKTPRPGREFGARYTVKQAIKYLIISGVIGAVAMLCWYAVKYVMSSSIKTEEDWKTFGIPVLGFISREEKKRCFQWLDRWIDCIFGRARNTTMEQDCVLTARSLSAMLQEQKFNEAKLIGHVDRAMVEDIVQKMETAAPGTGFSFAGDPKTEPETTNNLGTTDKVILVVENQTTKIKDISQILTLLRAWGKTVIGAIVIE